MKIIFLDIDGVLNSKEYYKNLNIRKGNITRFNPVAVGYIKNLIEEFSAKIVISSTWRFGAIKLLNEELTKSDLKKHLHKDWKTPEIYPSHRGKEIKMWLDKHTEVEKYLILDDDGNILNEQLKNFVKTEIKYGLSETNFKKAKKILGNNVA